MTGGRFSYGLTDDDRGKFFQFLETALIVGRRELLSSTRGITEISEKRHVAFYLAVVVLDLSQGEVGRMFGRDRASVRHGLARVEDRRDDGDFDLKLAMLELRLSDLRIVRFRRAAPAGGGLADVGVRP